MGTLLDVLASLGAKAVDRRGEGSWVMEASALHLQSLFGGALRGEVQVSPQSDEAIVFTRPEELAACGTLWLPDVSDTAGLLDAIADAHATLRARLDNDLRTLEALDLVGELRAPQARAVATLDLAGRALAVAIGPDGDLVLLRVDGQDVAEGQGRVVAAPEESDADSVRGALTRHIAALVGRGMIHAAESLDVDMDMDMDADEDADEDADGQDVDDPDDHHPPAASPPPSAEEFPTGETAFDSRGVGNTRHLSEEERDAVSAALDDSLDDSDEDEAAAGPPTGKNPRVNGSAATDEPTAGVVLGASTALQGSPPTRSTVVPSSDDGVPVAPPLQRPPAPPKPPALRPPSSLLDALGDDDDGSQPLDADVDEAETLTALDARKAAALFSSSEDDAQAPLRPDPAHVTAAGNRASRLPPTAEPQVEDPISVDDFPGLPADADLPQSSPTSLTPPPDDLAAEELSNPPTMPVNGIARPARDIVEAPPRTDPASHASQDRASFEADGFDDAGFVDSEETATRTETLHVTPARGAAAPTTGLAGLPSQASPPVTMGAVGAAPDANKDAFLDASQVQTRALLRSDLVRDARAAQRSPVATAPRPVPPAPAQPASVSEPPATAAVAAAPPPAAVASLHRAARTALNAVDADDEPARLETEAAELEARAQQLRERASVIRASRPPSAAPAAELSVEASVLPSMASMDVQELGDEDLQEAVHQDAPPAAPSPPSAPAPPAASTHDDDDLHAEATTAAPQGARSQGPAAAERHASTAATRAGSRPTPEELLEGVSFADVQAALKADLGRAEATQLVEAQLPDLQVSDSGDVFGSAAPSAGGQPPAARASTGAVGLLLDDPRARDRLSKRLKPHLRELVELGDVNQLQHNADVARLDALVLVRPRLDEKTRNGLKWLMANDERPRILLLSSDTLPELAEQDLRVALGERASEVAQQVLDGLAQLGVPLLEAPKDA